MLFVFSLTLNYSKLLLQAHFKRLKYFFENVNVKPSVHYHESHFKSSADVDLKAGRIFRKLRAAAGQKVYLS